MKITYDKIADAAYMTLRKGKAAKTVEMSDSVIVDLDKKGNILGIEMLNASEHFPKNPARNVPIELISRQRVVA